MRLAEEELSQGKPLSLPRLPINITVPSFGVCAGGGCRWEPRGSADIWLAA